MKLFKGRSSRQVNLLLKRKGPIWQRAYHDHAARENEDIRGMARYIVFNPIRAGLVNKIWRIPVLGCNLAVDLSRNMQAATVGVLNGHTDTTNIGGLIAA